MKRAFICVTAAAIALGCAGGDAAASAPQQTKKPALQKTKKPTISKWQQHVNEMLRVSAPGDEYFGRMKMSYLGINNTFHDDAIRAGAYTTDPRLLSGIGFADEALNAWAQKYPGDPQLARSYFLAFEMYRKVWTPEGQQKAWQYMRLIAQKWPASFFGKTVAKELKIGFTEHYFASPAPCALPTATISVAPTLAPAATPTVAPGQPTIEILPVPCYTPAPMPSLTPLPSPSPTPSP